MAADTAPAAVGERTGAARAHEHGGTGGGRGRKERQGRNVSPTVPHPRPTIGPMGYPVPSSLSPSRVDAFTSCPLAFRFSAIERLPEPPSVAAIRGTLVHRALELLFAEAPGARTAESAHQGLGRAIDEARSGQEWALLGLDEVAEGRLVAECAALVDRYFALENPNEIRAIGLELRMEAKVGNLTLRGIIDRLELGPAGELVVTDYKTGKPPAAQREQGKLAGVHFYAFLCEQVLGHRPARIRLLYLGNGTEIVAYPTEQSIRFLPKRTAAVWQAVEKACTSGEFKPRTGPLCNYCSFQLWCPAFGGDPDRAAVEAPIAIGQRLAPA